MSQFLSPKSPGKGTVSPAADGEPELREGKWPPPGAPREHLTCCSCSSSSESVCRSMEGLMAHTMNATSIFRSQRMYEPFKYSQLLGEDKTRCLMMAHLCLLQGMTARKGALLCSLPDIYRW